MPSPNVMQGVMLMPNGAVTADRFIEAVVFAVPATPSVYTRTVPPSRTTATCVHWPGVSARPNASVKPAP
ncbi:MAG: hypothetical protein LW860_01300 [Xanthomonadaceae bacterium]|nr:hypothetical protein [Xanthomonadaceae bacterium]